MKAATTGSTLKTSTKGCRIKPFFPSISLPPSTTTSCMQKHSPTKLETSKNCTPSPAAKKPSVRKISI